MCIRHHGNNTFSVIDFVHPRLEKGTTMVDKKSRLLQEPHEEQPLDVQGFERPRDLIQVIDEDLAPLLDLAQRPVVSASQFTHVKPSS